MLKKYEVEDLICGALEDLNGTLVETEKYGEYTLADSKVIKDDNGDLILTYKEDCFSNDKPDKYRIKIEYYEE